jgi:hypothetical protein
MRNKLLIVLALVAVLGVACDPEIATPPPVGIWKRQPIAGASSEAGRA